MRPDLISPEHTPTLHRLVLEGVDFRNHHAVFVSSTEVNGTAIATGMHPGHSGVIANKEFRPQIDPTAPVAMEEEKAVRRGDSVYGGRFIAVPTLAEIVQQSGLRTAVVGTKAVTMLFDRNGPGASADARNSVDFCKGLTLPATAIALLEKANQDHGFPTNVTYPNIAQDAWTTRALTQGLWEKDVPKFSVLWLSDPDYTQHDSAPGSPAALASLESADRNLASVLAALAAKNVRDKTDIFLVSDHGFSTVQRAVDVADVLGKAGFNAVKALTNSVPNPVLVVALGGSVSLYVPNHDAGTLHRLVAFLQTSDFAGVILSRLPLPGTFPLDKLRIDTVHAPDLLVSLRWNDKPNKFGVAGMLVADTNKKGTHASLSPFDMHNTLVAAGPDFRSGFSDTLPSGNTDLAPTILWILGLRPPGEMDGRILREALVGHDMPSDTVKQRTIEASTTAGSSVWHQYLKFTTVGNALYFDEGNGGPASQ